LSAERILLCMDGDASRRFLGAALSSAPGIEVAGAVPADESGVRAAAARQPDVVVLESSRAGVEGAKLVARLRAVAPGAGVIALAGAGDRPRSIAARALTADRYVEPGVPAAQLRDAVLEFTRERRRSGAAS
jgi:DNA-binding NarL/FixJ family response regulator